MNNPFEEIFKRLENIEKMIAPVMGAQPEERQDGKEPVLVKISVASGITGYSVRVFGQWRNSKVMLCPGSNRLPDEKKKEVMMHGISRAGGQKNERTGKPVERPVRFPVQYRKEPDGIRAGRTCTSPRDRRREELKNCHLCREHPYHTSDFARKVHPIRQRFTESCRTRAYVPQHGVSEPYLFGTDRDRQIPLAR